MSTEANQAPGTRRTEGLRNHGRSARVVQAVLQATAELLGEMGYAALKVEDVASRSGVNKTTIYRRWPSKAELVGAALVLLVGATIVPDTGSFRGDLLALLRQKIDATSTPLGRGVVRVLQMERAHPEVDALTRTLRAENLQRQTIVGERAIARGELPAGTDVRLVVEMATVPVMHRLLQLGEAVDEALLQRVVAVVVAGAKAGAAM